MTEEMKAMIELVNQSLKEGKSMSKADKMFEELGYTLNEETNYSKELSEGIYLDIDFTDDFKQYVKTHKIGWEVYQTDIFLDEHLAIHEKMKESGWLYE